MWDFTKQYELTVNINGRTVDEYPHTDNNIYIEGRPGSEYTIEIKNNSHEEICAIPSVDGLSIFDGKEAGLNSKGYIIDRFGKIVIPGWTLNNNQVAKFEFGDTKSSYTNQMGNGTSNTGVIGVMIFRKKPEPVLMASSMRGMLCGSGGSGPATMDWHSHTDDASSDAAAAQSLGTGFGGTQAFNVREVSFEKRDPQNPDALLALFYDSVRGLERRGIRVGVKHNPSPFPTYVSQTTGCTPPPGWVKK